MTVRDLPRLEVSEGDISTGSIVVDLASGKALQVVGKSAQTAGEHPQTRSDATAEMFGAGDDEPVFMCVFLPDGEKVTPPKKSYAYPESRLLRYPTEKATDYAGGIQYWMKTAFIQQLADGVSRSGNRELRSELSDLLADVYSEEISRIFDELIDVDRGEVP